MRFPDLHRVGKLPDWELVEPETWNRWQKRAAKTNGIDTLANRTTIVGGIVTILGLKDIYKDNTIRGALLVGAGRVCDMADGAIADATGTKSSFGETLDASVDTVLMAAALPVIAHASIISAAEAKTIAAIHATKSIATVGTKMNGEGTHPSRSGKIAVALQWAGIGLRTFANAAEQHNQIKTARALETSGTIALHTGIALGAIATIGYINDFIHSTANSLY